ncbi:MAG: SDR family oxidoreductase [archaeon]
MDLGIRDRRVLITGASQGIGRAIALEFAKEGCKVAVIARREEKLRELIKEIGGKEKGHAYFATDLMKKAEPTRAVKELAKGGNFDIVVHNLGGTLGIKDPLAPVEDWNKVWQLNVGVAIEMNALLIPPMQAQQWGRIIHVSSNSAEFLRGSPAYGAAKAYLNAYTKVLGRAVAKEGIVVSALMPGAIYAKGQDSDEESGISLKDREAFLKKREEFLRQQQAIGRLGTPEEIAPFAVFMASKHATFAQASIIPIDGGTM